MTLRFILLFLAFAISARADEIDYKKLYAQTAPAVVLVYATDAGDVSSIGTGSIIREDGLVVTNAHVILKHDTQKPWDKIYLFLKPDKITGNNQQDLKTGYQALWLVYNPALDLALLKLVDPPGKLPVLAVSDDTTIGVGEATAAIGHPEQGAKWSLTTGRVGGEWTDFDGVKGKDVYQMETSVNRGNSGGPLLDGNGNMIGINTCIARRAPDGLAITGINFAVKSSVVRQWLADNSNAIAAATAARPAAAAPALVVTDAQPAPEAQETVPPPGTPPTESKNEIAYVVTKAPAQPATSPSRRIPPPPHRAKASFTSRLKPGRILSGAELIDKYAKEGFQEMDQESAQQRK